MSDWRLMTCAHCGRQRAVTLDFLRRVAVHPCKCGQPEWVDPAGMPVHYADQADDRPGEGRDE